jgi:hypothetical protein
MKEQRYKVIPARSLSTSGAPGFNIWIGLLAVLGLVLFWLRWSPSSIVAFSDSEEHWKWSKVRGYEFVAKPPYY